MTFPPYYCRTHESVLTQRGSALVCSGGERYAVRDEIPRFVERSAYTASFGAQWNVYRTTQLDSYTHTTISRDRLRRCLGDELWASLAGKEILECGCGAGRFTEILVELGAHVTSIDMSEAVTANRDNVPLSEPHRVAQADLTQLPFAPRQYDIVLCIGVLQHTPDTAGSLRALFEHVRPGGWLVVDHYRYNPRRYFSAAMYVRPILRRLPPRVALAATRALVRIFYPLHERMRGRIGKLILGRISPVAYHRELFPQLDEKHLYPWALLETHDSLTDYYKRLLTYEQFRGMLEALGGEALWCERGGNGIEARLRRPLGEGPRS